MVNVCKVLFNVLLFGSKLCDLKNESWFGLELNFLERYCGYNIFDGVCL